MPPEAFARLSRRQAGGQERSELGRIRGHGVFVVRMFLHVYSGLIEQRQFGQCQLVSRWRVLRAVHALEHAFGPLLLCLSDGSPSGRLSGPGW